MPGVRSLSALLGALVSLTSTAEPFGPDERPPNVLLVIADDLGTDMLASYGIGQDVPSTPTLDQLAQRGVQFRNAWSAPVCSPTRACLQTGRFGFRTGLGMTVRRQSQFGGLAASEVILPEMLDAGTGGRYAHAFFGKWHLNHEDEVDTTGAPQGPDAVRQMGYGHHAGTIHNIVGPEAYDDWTKLVDGVASKTSAYATTDIVDDFLAWEATVSQPWFAVLAFHAPHTPIHAPPPALHTTDLSTAGSIKADPRPYFKAMVEAMDAELGRALAGLGEELVDTSVIFLGDNGTPGPILDGDPFGTLPRDHGKGSVFEGGVNVPLLVAGPRVTAPGREVSSFVHVVDVFATLAELAGVDLTDPGVIGPGRELDSRSLVPFLSDPTPLDGRGWNYTERFLDNTPAGAQVDESQHVRDHLCQEVVEGTVVPGAPALTMCGAPLVANTDNASVLRVTGALPGSTAFLVAGYHDPAPAPQFGGLVTQASTLFDELKTSTGKYDLDQPFQVDASGELVVPDLVFQKAEPFDFVLEVAFLDPFTGTWSLSNAVTVVQTMNVKAVVGESGYKLIAFVTGGPSRLYHLPTDPTEATDLLTGGLQALTPGQRAAYDELRAVLFEQLGSARGAPKR